MPANCAFRHKSSATGLHHLLLALDQTMQGDKASAVAEIAKSSRMPFNGRFSVRTLLPLCCICCL